MLAGCTPVGVGIDETLGLIDLNSSGSASSWQRRWAPTCCTPVLAPSTVEAGGRHALERARAGRRVLPTRTQRIRAASAFDEPEASESFSGTSSSRNPEMDTGIGSLPGLSALLDVSRRVGATVLGLAGTTTVAGHSVHLAPGNRWPTIACRRFAGAMTVEAVGRLARGRRVAGSGDHRDRSRRRSQADDIAAILVRVPGVLHRHCRRTLGAASSSGDEMQRLAASAGLVAVPSVTKTRCEHLITAESAPSPARHARHSSGASRCSRLRSSSAWLAEGERR